MHYDWSVQVHIHPIKLEYIVICTCEFFRIGARRTNKNVPLDMTRIHLYISKTLIALTDFST